MRKHVFVDTMLFLHFRQLDEIDWQALVGADEVEVLLAPVVWRQLDRHKDQHPTPGLRERARTSVGKLRGWLGQGTAAPLLRGGVALRLLHEDPRIDFTAHRLAKDVEDDQLVATLIEYGTSSADEVVLVTDDILLRQKAAAAGIRALAIPEAYRLEPPASEAQKKLKKLEDENRLLKSRMPDLRLSFASGQAHCEHVLTPSSGWSAEYKTELLERERAKHPLRTVRDASGTNDLERLILGQQEKLAQDHNERLEDHFERYRKYLDDAEKYAVHRSRGVVVELWLHNSGTAPASDIDVFLKAEAPVFALEGDSDLMRQPRPPVLEEPQITPWDNCFGSVQHAIGVDVPSLWDPSMAIRQRDDGLEIEFGLRKLKQGLSVALPRFWLLFPDERMIAPFRATYRINCEDRPQEQTGALDFVVRRRV
jgi:hypothetical protein